ncbi:MAG: hypothetical protein LC624_00555 [Halobacteriales archaeon]|nr:hypothetical protein [Halobacteriales archaeon]
MSTPGPRLGIAGVAAETGDLRLTSEDLARLTGIPQRILEEKMGIKEICRWGPDPGPDAMALKVVRRALGGLDPRKLDMVLMICHPLHAEAELAGYGHVLKDRLGAERAEVLEISDTCASTCLALQVVRDLMAAEPELRHVMVVGIMLTMDSVDVTNPRTGFLTNVSDGVGAMLLSRDDGDELDTAVLGGAHEVDPSFIEDLAFTPPQWEEPAGPKRRYRSLLPRRVDIVVDKDGFKNRLDPVTYPAYVAVIREALRRSGFRDDEVDLVGANTMKPSLWKAILDNFKLEPSSQMYLPEGHVAFLDQLLYIERIRATRRFPDGGVVVLTSAGMGFHWAATCVAFKGRRTEGRLP